MSQTYFNDRAGIWDETAAEKDPLKLEDMVRRLSLIPGSTILDIGTGTGILLPFLLRAINPGGRILGLDFACQMLKKAIGKTPADSVCLLLADANCIPAGDRSFDAVICYSSFPHFGDKPHVLAEIYHTLKAGGRLFICHTSSREHINRIHRQIPSVCHDLLPGNEEMRQMLSDTGFKGIQINDGDDSYLVVAVKSNL